MVVFGQKWLYSDKSSFIPESGCIRGKVVVFDQMWMYSDNLVILGKSCFYKGNVVVFGQKWLKSGNCGCIRAKVVVILQKSL